MAEVRWSLKAADDLQAIVQSVRFACRPVHRRRRLIALAVIVSAVAIGLTACNRQPRPQPGSVNVLLITVDTLRPDRLSCYGYSNSHTPHIDRLAAEGVLFERAYCDVPWTTPSMASVHTGLYAIHHGFKSTYQQLDDANVTLAEAFKSKGYTTAAFIGSFPLDSSFKLNQGFDSYDENFDTPSVAGGKEKVDAHIPATFHANVDDQRLFQFLKARADAFREDAKVSDATIAWLQQQPKRPFFLWVHYFGPHERTDLSLSEEDARAKMLREYDPDLQKTDTAVGRLLDALTELGLEQNTLVILHADHGQSLGQHYYFGHGKNLYDPTLRIPLIMRFPGQIPRGKRVAAMVRNVDIFPTALDLAGYAVPAGLDGTSLAATMRGRGEQKGDADTYCETYLSDTEAFGKLVRYEDNSVHRVGFVRRGVRTPEWMYVVNEPAPFIDYSNPTPVPPYVLTKYHTEELYDLKKDPGQTTNVIGKRPLAQMMMRNKLTAYLHTSRAPSKRRELDEAAKERMRSLGYMK
jgi:arylsulfatase A-like enzyme